MICKYAYLCNLQKCKDCSFPECSHTTDMKYCLISEDPTEMKLVGCSNGVKYYMEYLVNDNKNKRDEEEAKEICSAYHEELGRCWGTKEMDICSCGGDTNECDFYPEKRRKKNNAGT